MEAERPVASHQLSLRDSETCQKYILAVKKANQEKREETGRSPRAYVLTFGCQQNEADSEKLAGLAFEMGYEKAAHPDEADLIIVNTCAVREHAEQKALSIVGQYKHLKARNPELVIVMCGCMVTQAFRQNEIKHNYPYVDIVFGASSMFRFPQLLWEHMEKERRLIIPDEETYLVAEGLPVRRNSTYRAWVSIMYGCNNFCTYCIVPYVRGRERSRSKEDIISEVEELVKQGYKDITLLGQNVNSYGHDNQDGVDFADLLALIDNIEGDYTIHFMTSHPKDATEKLIDVIASGRHIAHHFHLPLQSGSDRILKAMNRHYDAQHYRKVLNYLRQRIPDVTVTSDIMVGFPGETEEDFCDTLSFLAEARFDMIFSFIYSPRKGTPAAEAADQIQPEVKSDRFSRLLQQQNEISLESNRRLVGSTLRVLCDGPSKNDPDVWSGRTDGNKIVFFDGSREDIGRFLTIRITRAEAFALYGEKESHG